MITLNGLVDWRGEVTTIVGEVGNDFDKSVAQHAYGCRTRNKDARELRYIPDPLVVHSLNRLFDGKVTISSKLREWGQRWDAEHRRLAEIQTFKDTEVGSRWDDKLRPYQRVGVRWIAESHHCILGDDPGSGKTIQALVADQMTNSRRTLILCPLYIIPVWVRHLREWLGVEPVVAWDRKAAVRASLFYDANRYMITNHESLRTFDELLEQTFDHIIVDEAHRFQGRTSKQSKGLKKLTTRTAKITLLTGSPMWNRPDSLWNLLNVLYPKRFPSYWKFVDYFCESERTRWSRKIVGPNMRTIEQLRWLLAPLLLRRRKVDVLPDLPPKIVQTIEYDLGRSQRKQYKLLKDKLRMQTDYGEHIYHFSGAGALVDMRRLINMPDVMGVGARNVKLDIIKQILLDSSLPVVIFVWHRDYAKYLAHELDGSELTARWLTGELDVDERQRIIDAFQDGNIDVLVANISAAGLGIDLHRASTAIFAEGALPGHLNEQAEDRLHRIGQTNTTTIYRLQATRTVEQRLWQMSEQYQTNAELTLATTQLIKHILGDD